MRTQILLLFLALVTFTGVQSTADSTGKMLKYKGTQSLKVGKKTYKCAFNIAYTSTACGKKTVKCKPNPKKLTLEFPQIDADDATLDVTVVKNKITTCNVDSTHAVTTPPPGPGLEERVEALETMISNLTNSLENSIASISSSIQNLKQFHLGIAILSSQYGSPADYGPLKCLDGNADTLCICALEDNPYFMMEYPTPVSVIEVKVQARNNVNAIRVKNVVVTVTDTKPTRGTLVSGTQLGSKFIGPASKGQWISFTSGSGIEGKYVVVQQQYTGYLNFAEVEVRLV